MCSLTIDVQGNAEHLLEHHHVRPFVRGDEIDQAISEMHGADVHSDLKLRRVAKGKYVFGDDNKALLARVLNSVSSCPFRCCQLHCYCVPPLELLHHLVALVLCSWLQQSYSQLQPFLVAVERRCACRRGMGAYGRISGATRRTTCSTPLTVNV